MNQLESINKFLTTLVFCIFSLFAGGQSSLEEYVKKNAVPIESIDPAANNYSELEPLGNAIGDAKVVMLGEQDHGDAPTFLAKTRIIKYLHEKKGFNIIAFESDFFGLNIGWDNITKETNEVESFIRKNIYPIWTHCDACAHLLYNYIPNSYKTTAPLVVSGFDSQLYLDFSINNLVTKLDSVLKAVNAPIAVRPEYTSSILLTLDSLITIRPKTESDSGFYKRCDTYLKEIKHDISQKLNENNIWSMLIDNLIELCFQNKNLNSNTLKAQNARDFQMAQNLKWLVNARFPDQKIIVWAANDHIARFENSPGVLTRMGKYFAEDTMLNKISYVIAFTSYGGTAGRIGGSTFTIREPKNNSVETWIARTYKYAFMDFKAYNKIFPNSSKPFYMKALNHKTFFKANWTKAFDGVFYIKEMYPCKGI